MSLLPEQAKPPDTFDYDKSWCYTIKNEKHKSIQVHLKSSGLFYVVSVVKPEGDIEADKKGGAPVQWGGKAKVAWAIAQRVAGWC